jgi:hypothetical protein
MKVYYHWLEWHEICFYAAEYNYKYNQQRPNYDMEFIIIVQKLILS